MEEKFLQIDDNKIRYLESGDSQKTLVLVHGLGASSERWAKVIPIFAKHYRVLVPDLIGFGYSDKPLVDYTPQYFSDFLSKFFSLTNTKSASIIGSSLGGQVSAEFTLSYPQKVEKLILSSPAGVMEHSTPALDAYIMAALYPNEVNAKKAFELMESSGEEVPEDLVNGFVERMKLPNAKLAFMSTILGLKNSKLVSSKLESIVSPTLLIWGVDDPVIPIEYADIFTSKIPNCQLFKMERCGHTPYVQDPQTFSSKSLEFLAN
ncbi:MAG: alpha/beta fold hydrolase [Candidatus Nitrosopumilus sp. bin_68KS]